MTDYISKNAAICIADYAADEHPYDKNPEKPETYSDYNQGWNDACDYIREQLENAVKEDVAPVAVDAVLVVRCKDCAESAILGDPAENRRYCAHLGFRVEDEGFCCDGRRAGDPEPDDC